MSDFARPIPAAQAFHPETSLIATKLAVFEKLSTDAIVRSLEVGQPHCLKTRPDGTILDGHHRIHVLRLRNCDVDALPREILKRPPSET